MKITKHSQLQRVLQITSIVSVKKCNMYSYKIIDALMLNK